MDRAAQKIRKRESDHEGAERRLIEHGARAPRAMEDPAAWLAAALDSIGARKVRHPGNHRYLFTLGTRRDRTRVVIGLRTRAYPKKHAGQLDLGLAA